MLNSKPIILIADDEPNICRIAKLVIDPDKYDIITAENGFDAYEKTLKHQPTLIFSDILMPKCNGFEFCKKVKENSIISHTPFIFLSTIEKETFLIKYEETDADDYIMKPFTSDNIIEKVEKWITEKPIINAESSNLNVTTKTDNFAVGLADIDSQLGQSIPKNAFIFAYGAPNCNTQQITSPFIEDGLKKQQTMLQLSLNHQEAQPSFNQDIHETSKYLSYVNASQWTNIASNPWRNLDYIYDFLSEQCEQRPIHRIVIDGLHQGFPFWDIKDILKFIDLCKTLPNNENQIMLWTSFTHPKLSLHKFYIQNVMDIGIQLTHKDSTDNITLYFNRLSKKNTHSPIFNQ
jgi:CheY-like chemotaxis protein